MISVHHGILVEENISCNLNIKKKICSSLLIFPMLSTTQRPEKSLFPIFMNYEKKQSTFSVSFLNEVFLENFVYYEIYI
jgi:hypothetical protein